MALLRINCPWKKYLTMAQLVQFTTVVIYSMVSLCVLPSHTHWKHYSAIAIQCGEMISLFLLFLHFYNKSYGKKQPDSGTPTKQGSPATAIRTSETSDTGSDQSSLSSESD